MPNDTADEFAHRMSQLAATDFGSKRPELGAAIATGSQTPDDMARIASFVTALDEAQKQRANLNAGIFHPTGPQSADLLNSVGESQAIVRRANTTASDGVNPAASNQWLVDTGNTVSRYLSNSGDVVFPQPKNFSGKNQAPDGTSNENIFQKAWGGILDGLSAVGNVPGFVYRWTQQETDPAYFWIQEHIIGRADDKDIKSQHADFNAQQGQNAETMKLLGYNPDSLKDQTAFLWSHGEADFTNLEPVIAKHGRQMVNRAIEMFAADEGYGSNGNWKDAVGQYNAKLADDLRNGKITDDEYVQAQQDLNSPDFQAAYQAVDQAHVSPGRDIARTIVNPETHPDAFKYISGTSDFLFSMLVDPTLAGTKLYKSIKVAKYGVDLMADAPQALSRLYGTVNPVTGELSDKALNQFTYRGAYKARANVDSFLDYGKKIRAAEAAGELDTARRTFAELEARHPDLMPAYQAMMGKRLALTDAERAAANEAGTTMTLGGDAIHESIAPRGGRTAQEIVDNRAKFAKASLPMTTGKPLETRQEFVDWLSNQAGLQVMFAGQAPKGVRMLPGLMGPMAEARAAFAARQAFTRNLTLLDDDALSAIGKTLDLSSQAGKVIADDAGEALKAAFVAAGLEQGARLGGRHSDEWRSFATQLRARSEAGVRAITTLLPTNHALALNSMQAGKDIERFARTAMPRAEAAFARYMWEQAPNEAARRQIGKAVINQVAAAMGLTRTTVGREFMDKWNLDFDAAARVRYAEGDTDIIPDAINGGDRRVAMNMSQLETHLILPDAVTMRRMSAKGAILGFDKQIGDIVARGHSSWFKDAAGNKDVTGGLMRMLASPTLTLRYGLFGNAVLKRAFGIMKLGWLATTSNMLRQLGEEYAGLYGAGQQGALKIGKSAIRQSDEAYKAVSGGARTNWGLKLDNAVHQLVVAAHHIIPSDVRASIRNEEDVHKGIILGRLKRVFGDTPLTPAQDRAVTLAADRVARPETLELIGGRAAADAEGGVAEAQAAHAAGVQTARYGWTTHSKFQGYVDGDLEGDTGRKALAARYGQQFLDPNEPARRALAYIMWNHAAENPKFLKSLDENTLKLMESLYPPARSADGKLLGAQTDHLKNYVANAEETATFRQRAEVLNHDENGYPIQPGNQVAKDAAVERFSHNSIAAVAATVFGRNGKINAHLVSDLLRGKIPSESDLARVKLKDLPEHISRAEFAPEAPGAFAKLGEVADNVAALATKAFDHVVTNPMARIERKPLYIGNYVKSFEKLQPFEEHLVMNLGMKPTEAERIVDQIAAGMAMHDTIRYIDNPRIASQFSMIAQNFWLFYRAQEDWVRRWSRIVKENPEVLRMAHAGIISGQNAGIIHRDEDGSLTLSYPGSGAVIDAMMHAANGLGVPLDKAVKLPVVHDLTTKVNYLNPSMMNPVGFSGTPMLSIPFDMLAAAIPGSDMLRSQTDMAMNGQIGNGRAWWEQFMPTAINRFIQLTPLDGSPDSGASHVGSAAQTAILNATLAGQMGTGDDVVSQDQITNLKTQTINALITRALFSFMAPGPASMPELDYTDKNGKLSNPNADWGWRAQGIQDLDSEYKAMIQAFGVQKAMVLWAKLHPDKLAVEVGKTRATAKGASMDPTMDSVKWIFDNKALFDGPYRRVAAYFIPPAPGSFDQTGWNALMEIGARQHKSLTEYYTDIASKNAVTLWFQEKDRYEAERAHAKALGQETKAIDEAHAAKNAQIKTEYPVINAWLNESASRKDERRQSVDTLRAMVSDPSVNLPELQGVAQMLIVLDNYNASIASIKGQRNSQATATRDALQNAYRDNMEAIVKQFPGLNDMYQGVFRQVG